MQPTDEMISKAIEATEQSAIQTEAAKVTLSPKFTLTPSYTLTPTITLTPTLTLTPTITLTPTVTLKPSQMTATAVKATKQYREEVRSATATAVQATKDFMIQFKGIHREELIYYSKDYIGEKLHIHGQVRNIIDKYTFQMWIAGSHDSVIVTTSKKLSHLYEKSNITAYGILKEEWCGINIFGGEICLPQLGDAFYIEN